MNIKIDEFDGPLDLLLHLVKEANIDIYDINISEITVQYMDYIHEMEELDIDIASSYLVMASTLMELKAKALLPDEKITVCDNEEEITTREDLIERLAQYQKYKEVTNSFKFLEKQRRDIYTKAPTNLNQMMNQKFVNDTGATIDDLMNAFSKFLERKNYEKPLLTKVTNKEYSVRARKNYIINLLNDCKEIGFTQLFTEYNKSFVIVTFISILELAKEDSIILVQDGNFDKIMIELKVK